MPERRAGAHAFRSAKAVRFQHGRPADRNCSSFARRRDSGSVPRGTGWGKPQGGGIPREPGRRLRRGNPVAVVPTGWRMKPLKRGRRREIRRRRPASRAIDDPGHCRPAKAAPTGGCDARRKACGRPLPEEMDPGGKSRLERALAGRRTRQSHEGKRCREAARFQSGQALKGEPRERARLKEIGEFVEGERRRGAAEARGRNLTRAVECPGVRGSRWMGSAEGAKNLGRAKALKDARIAG